MGSYADRIKPDSYGIITFLERLLRGRYQIPTFQRDVVWDWDRVKRLWDSIYKFYPLGSILVWCTETKLQNHREIGGHLLHTEQSTGEFQYLLDGQQRATALLTTMYGGKIKGQDERDPHLYIDLTVESFDEIEDESWRERFLFWDEIDDRDKQLFRNIGRKKRYDSGLIVKLSDIAHRYSDLERCLVEAGRTDFDDPAREQLRNFKQVFDNYKLSFIELRGIEIAEVCQVFERINQAGQPLSIFDIVVAKTFRPATNEDSGFYLRGLFEQFRQSLQNAGSRFISIDDLTLLQILAVLVRENIPDSGVQNITPRYLNVLRAKHVESLWEDSTKAIKKVFDFFDNHLHLPGPALIPSRYFYMTLAPYFFRNPNPDYSLLKRYFWYFSFHNEDLLSNTTHLRDHVRRFRQVREGGEFGFDRFLIDRDSVRRRTYSSRARLTNAILSLYANQNPLDWEHQDRSVLNEVYYTLTDQPNLHHIFPRAFCEQLMDNQDTYVDSMLNIAYLTQITNLQISSRNPLEYMRRYITGTNFKEVQRRHFLPDNIVKWAELEEMPDNALQEFVDARLDLIIEKLQEYLDEIPFEVIDTRNQPTAIGY